MTEELKVIITAEIGKLKSATDKAKNEIKSFKDQVEKAKKDVDDNFKSMGDGIGKAMTVGAATATAALASVGTAIAALTKASVSNYAEYEQLTGGVETLFKTSSDAVMEYAKNAYKTAGMSANEYMATVTGFSASLLQSLGGDTEQAAKVADMALSDMADNANKMGTSMEMIQNAYGGFAKQNYTMLDNLKLGYGGTKEEMERLLADAEKFSGIKYDINNLNDVYQAIHVIQNEMGITGTTAKEAASTISGSIGMTKAAWTNLMTGLADGNADIPQLVQDVISSATAVLANVIPAVKEVIKNIPVAISEISPEAGAAFQKVVDVIMEVLPILKDALQVAFDLVVDTINFVSENTGIITAAAVAIGVIATAIGVYNTVAAIKAAMAAAEVTTVWGLVAAYAAQAAAMIVAIAPYVLIVAAIAAVIAIIVLCIKHWDDIKEAASKAIKFIKEKFGEMAEKIKESFENFKKAAVEKFEAAKQAMADKAKAAKESVVNTFNAIKDGITDKLTAAKNKVTSIFTNIKNGITEKIQEAKNKVSSVVDGIKGLFNFEFKLPKIKTPSFAIKPSGWSVGDLLKGSIPKLSVKWNAVGGVFESPTILRHGNSLQGLAEDGAEAIVPLEKNTQWLDKIADKLASRQASTPVILNVDGKVFAQTAISTINENTRQTGSLQLNIK
jgi:phage-related protein